MVLGLDGATACVETRPESDANYQCAGTSITSIMLNSDRNDCVLDVINLMDKIMRDKKFTVEQRRQDLEQIAACALKFSANLRHLNDDK